MIYKRANSVDPIARSHTQFSMSNCKVIYGYISKIMIYICLTCLTYSCQLTFISHIFWIRYGANSSGLITQNIYRPNSWVFISIYIYMICADLISDSSFWLSFLSVSCLWVFRYYHKFTCSTSFGLIRKYSWGGLTVIFDFPWQTRLAACNHLLTYNAN